MEDKMVLVHPWQDKGLGKAPFRCIGIFSFPNPASFGDNINGYNYAVRQCSEQKRALGVEHGGFCDVCGMNLMNNFVILSSDGKRFVVGCDCAGKTGDSMLMSEVDAKERERKRLIRREKTRIANEARRAAIEAEYQAERERNGGLTDYEVAEQARHEAERQARYQHEQENLWLVKVLETCSQTDFICAMTTKLQAEPFNDGYFSRGQFNALVNVYCHGYKSNARNERHDEMVRKFAAVGPDAVHHSWK